MRDRLKEEVDRKSMSRIDSGKGSRPTEKGFWKRRDDSEKEDGVMEKERRTMVVNDSTMAKDGGRGEAKQKTAAKRR